jgi:L-amino acid N-acyltransferase YncA
MPGGTDRNRATLVRPARIADAAAIRAIYNHYVEQSWATFETEAVRVEEMAARIDRTLCAPLPWLVAVAHERIAGYACAAPWKARSAYRHSVELSAYLDPRFTRQGIGTRLYAALLERVRALEMHAVVVGVALPNDASISLHERFGFRKVAHFEQVGYKFGRWIDVGYWQLLL